jgi:O-antigen ligase
VTEAETTPAAPAARTTSLAVRVAETLPALLAVLVFVWWASAEGGFSVARSYPGGLLVLGALVVVGWARPQTLVATPLLVRAAVVLAALLGLLSLLSFLWADVPADAWDGGNRTLLYAACFALFAFSRLRASSLAVLLAIWSSGVAAVGVATLVSAATDGDLGRIFVDNRLSQPLGYVNGTCALLLMAFWPALVLASRRELPLLARPLLLGAAFVLADLALITQSRASVVAMPVSLVAAFVLVPGRIRLAVTLLPVGIAVALTARPMLDIFTALGDGRGREASSDALVALGLGFVAVVAVGLLLAWGDRRVSVDARTARRADLAFAVAATALVLFGATGAAVAAGDPAGRLSDAWDEFNSGYPKEFEGSHFNELGDYRPDLWRVALRQFADAPLVGAGADNFAPAYIEERRFNNEARFPHSTPLAILSSTGIVGGLLFVGLIGCAFVAYIRARRDSVAAALGAAAVLVFTHWFVHGSVDWFWEIPALGAPALAFLGGAAALWRPQMSRTRSDDSPRSARWGTAAAGVVAIAAVAAAAAATPQWLASRQTADASAGWQRDPARSIRELEQAAELNPLSARPFLLAGAIANRTERHREARRLLLRALERSGVNWYAKLELGIAEAALGNRPAALDVLREAAELNPRETAVEQVREWVATGDEVDLEAIDTLFLQRLAARTSRERPGD